MARIVIETPSFKVGKAPIIADPPCNGQSACFSGYNQVYLMTGQKGSGKSNLLYDMIIKNKQAYKGRFDFIYLFTNSNTTNYPDYINQFSDGIDEEVLDVILKDETLKGSNICFIFDDCVSELIHSKTSKIIGQIMRNTRHVYAKKTETITIEDDEGEKISVEVPLRAPRGTLTVFLTTQVYNEIPLNWRKCASCVICFKPDIREYEFFVRDNLKNFLNGIDEIVFYNMAWSHKYDNLMINRTQNKLYKNFGLMTLK